MVFKAEKWLVFQAERFGITLDFENLQFGYEDDIVLDYIPDAPDEDHDTWVANLREKLDYRSADELLQTLYEEVSIDNILVLIVVNKKGSSYTLPFVHDADKENFLEAVVVYREDNSEHINSATIAHEVLHLFGACDLHKEDSGNGSSEDMVRFRFHDEIMLNLEEDIFDNNISELTAYYVGWHSKYQ
jgi:hypothetical protein